MSYALSLAASYLASFWKLESSQTKSTYSKQSDPVQLAITQAATRALNQRISIQKMQNVQRDLVQWILNAQLSKQTMQSQVEIPKEYLHRAVLDLQSNGDLRWMVLDRFGFKEYRIFKDETCLDQHLSKMEYFDIWEVEDKRGNTSKTIYKYYAWEEWNTCNNLTSLYEEISSGTEHGIFQIYDCDNHTSTYVQKENGWLIRSFKHINRKEAKGKLIEKESKQATLNKIFGIGTALLASSTSIYGIGNSFAKAWANMESAYENAPILQTDARWLPKFNIPIQPLNLLSATFFRNSCVDGLLGWTTAGLVMKNPFLTLIGLSGCIPKALSQEKVGEEFRVDAYPNETQSIPSVTGLKNGNFVIAWTSKGRGILRDVYGQLFAENGSSIVNAFQMNNYSINDQVQPYVTHLDNNQFIAAWTSDQQDGDRGGVYAQIFARNSSIIGREFRVNTVGANIQDGPSIAYLINGNFVIVWHDNARDGSGYGVYGQLFAGNNSKIGSEFRVNTYTNGWQWIPSAASLTNGDFIVTWAGQGPSGGDDIHGQLFAGNGTKIGGEIQINTNLLLIQSHSRKSVVRINDGFVAIWHSQDQDGYDIYGQLFRGNGSKTGSEFQVNTFTNHSQWRPSVDSFNNGNFVVVWHSETQDNDGFGAFAQLFDENATKIGNEFQVNTNITRDQKNPSVTTLQNGNFIVAWQSDQDGTRVFGQIFHDNITYPHTSTSTSSSTSSTLMSTTSIATSTLSSTIAKSHSLSSLPLTTVSSPNNSSIIWIGLGIGVVLCLGLAGGTVYIIQKRKEETDVEEQALGPITNVSFYNPSGKHETLEEENPYGFPGDVKEESDRDSQYQRTPDRVKAEDDQHYQHTPVRESPGVEF